MMRLYSVSVESDDHENLASLVWAGDEAEARAFAWKRGDDYLRDVDRFCNLYAHEIDATQMAYVLREMEKHANKWSGPAPSEPCIEDSGRVLWLLEYDDSNGNGACHGGCNRYEWDDVPESIRCEGCEVCRDCRDEAGGCECERTNEDADVEAGNQQREERTP